jgi:hypothetical protein
MPKLKLVEVTWWDAHTSSNWRAIQSVPGENIPMLCKTAGYVTDRNKDYLAIASSLSHNPDGSVYDVSSLTHIPIGMIKKTRVIKG